MSYLVDALKKAERERHVNQRADMRSLAEGEPPAHGLGSGRALRWLVGLLVICNAALLGYLFMPMRVSEAFVATDEPATVESPATSSSANEPPAREARPKPQTVPRPSASADGSAGAGPGVPPGRADPSAVAEREGHTGRDSASDKTLPSTHGDGDQRSLRLSDPPRSSGASVTYAPEPLDATPEWRGSNASTRAPSAAPNARGAGAPDVHINGHLYSTVPGRSFILVNGRRYHEGQRLAAGPAVETIDASGAVLNYRGQRYHVDGPS